MKKLLVLVVLTFMLVFVPDVDAALSPIWKECLQRGYEEDNDYCVFPDASKCPVNEFNQGECGQKFMTDLKCVEEGRYIWDGNCCSGLEAKAPDVPGQAVCQKIEQTINITQSSWQISTAVVLLGLGLGAVIFIRRKH